MFEIDMIARAQIEKLEKRVRMLESVIKRLGATVDCASFDPAGRVRCNLPLGHDGCHEHDYGGGAMIDSWVDGDKGRGT